jgi:hypothetical protein
MPVVPSSTVFMGPILSRGELPGQFRQHHERQGYWFLLSRSAAAGQAVGGYGGFHA